jgi:hypothetical protein
LKKLFTFIMAMFVAFGRNVALVMKNLQVPVFIREVGFINRAHRRENGFTSRLIGRRLYNSKGGLPGIGSALGLPSYIGPHRLLNSNGDIDIASTGFKYAIDNLSYIRAETVKQKHYEVAPADFMTVDVGEAPWGSEVIQNITLQNGGSFYEGDVNQGQGGFRAASVDVSLGKVRMPTQIWGKMTGWTIMEIAQAAAASKWDIVGDKLDALKTNWDLGIQRTAFLGHPQISTITGLLNNADVNINTSLITVPLSSMSATQFNAFVAGILAAYFTNSNSTEAKPNRLIIPYDDYLGLAALVPGTVGTYPIAKIQYLEEAFKRMCGPDFKIMPLAYSIAANNVDAGINKNRYVLYKDDPKTLKLSIPVDFTLYEARTVDAIDWVQKAIAQYAGVLVARPREVLYIDNTST